MVKTIVKNMKLALLVLASVAVIGGTASAAWFVAPSEPASPPPTPVRAAAVVPTPKAPEPARKPAPVLEAKRAPVPILYVPKAAYVPPTAQETAAPPPTEGMTEAAARAAIAADGYKGVRSLTKANGKWTARAMRGGTEISLTVAADGSVGAE